MMYVKTALAYEAHLCTYNPAYSQRGLEWKTSQHERITLDESSRNRLLSFGNVELVHFVISFYNKTT